MNRRQSVMLPVLAAATIMSLGLVGVSASETWSRTETRPYIMGDVGPLPGATGTGTLSFGPTIGEHVVISVEDQSGRAVGGTAMIRDGVSGDVFVWQTFCGTSAPITVVPGILWFYLDGPGDVKGLHWYDGPGCTDIGPVSLGGTTGFVHATFTGTDE